MQYHLRISSFLFQLISNVATDRAVVEAWKNALSYNRPILYLPITYAWFTEEEFLKPPVDFESKQNKAVLFVSNCYAEERNEYVEALMEAMPGQIDSYGGCWKNAQENEFHQCQGDKYTKKMCILSKRF